MTKLTTIAVALTLLGSSAALAQYNGNQNYGSGAGQQRSGDQYQNHNDNQQGRDENRNNGANGYGQQGYDQGRNEVRDNPHWSRGDKLPPEYRNTHVVSDWKNNHLRKPPRGYHWVEANNQYVLAAMTTGLIADIIMASNQNNRRTR